MSRSVKVLFGCEVMFTFMESSSFLNRVLCPVVNTLLHTSIPHDVCMVDWLKPIALTVVSFLWWPSVISSLFYSEDAPCFFNLVCWLNSSFVDSWLQLALVSVISLDIHIFFPIIALIPRVIYPVWTRAFWVGL